MRRHRGHPKPAEKEVKEAMAFFKRSEKLLGSRSLVIDCCGSHGLIGSLFVAYGKARARPTLPALSSNRMTPTAPPPLPLPIAPHRRDPPSSSISSARTRSTRSARHGGRG
jgi:hypothetical protein